MPDEFDAATKVMESGLLRVLTNESSDTDATAPPTSSLVTVMPAPPPPSASRSRIFVAAGIVAAVALAFDASLFLLHPRRATRPPAVVAAPDPMPRYMLVPLDAPPPPAAAAPAAPATTAAVAIAAPERPVLAVRSRRHHHRHASH